MGVVGMSMQDFCRLRPCELHSAIRTYNDAEEQKERQRWERMRIAAAIAIQLHTKKKITPKKLLPLPWDIESKPRTEAPTLSREEREARINQLLKRDGRKEDNNKA